MAETRAPGEDEVRQPEEAHDGRPPSSKEILDRIQEKCRKACGIAISSSKLVTNNAMVRVPLLTQPDTQQGRPWIRNQMLAKHESHKPFRLSFLS